jgi:hypothetical protein
MMMMTLIQKIAIILFFAGLLHIAIMCQTTTSFYEAYKTKIPIIIDGNLNDSAWAKATPINNFVINSNNLPSPYNTEAKILYDDKFIYFSFRCIDKNIWASKTNRDDHLWEEEVVEVFIKPNPDSTGYIEIEVNPLGTLLDAYMIDSSKNLPYKEWNIKDLKAAVHIEGTIDGEPNDTAWNCEIAFPLVCAKTAPNIPPKTGDIWFINLYRAELKPEYALISWSPTYRNDFHMPGFFGRLIFSKNEVP